MPRIRHGEGMTDKLLVEYSDMKVTIGVIVPKGFDLPSFIDVRDTNNDYEEHRLWHVKTSPWP